MKLLEYTFKEKKRSSTLLALGASEFEASKVLLDKELYREALIHMYFTCYYVSQSLLCKFLPGINPSHKSVDNRLHHIYGKKKDFPRSYVELHSALHNLRNDFSYKTVHSPNPNLLKRKYKLLGYYLSFVLKVVPRIEITEILSALYLENKEKIKDFSYDIYCPKTYFHHTRLTFWQPPTYLDIYKPRQLARHGIQMLKSLKVKRYSDYVVGINSRLDQYKSVHLILLDIDSVDKTVESLLKNYGGILLKSGRGFHFIGHQIIEGREKWEKFMRSIGRSKSLKNYVDKDFLEISLMRGYATLRVTESPVKPYIPFFYKDLNAK